MEGLDPSKRESVAKWIDAWEKVNGQIGQLAVRTIPTHYSTLLRLTAPHNDITASAPALEYKVRYPIRSNSHRPLAVGIRTGFSRPSAAHIVKPVTFDLPPVELMRLQSNDPTLVPEKYVALSGLTHRVNKIALAAQDPLKAAAPDIYQNVVANQKGVALRWAAPEQPTQVKVGFINVDPTRYGRNRYLAVMHNGKLNDSPPLIYTDDEWKAFVAGVKDGEFDVI